jgi:hypothetical protein
MSDCCIKTAQTFLYHSMTKERIKRIKRIIDNLKINTRISAKNLRESAGYGKKSQLFTKDMTEIRRYYKAIGLDLAQLHYVGMGNTFVYVLTDPSQWNDINRINFN